MSRVELFEAIRRDARLEELSIRALAERHGVHRRTVRQALAAAAPPARKASGVRGAEAGPGQAADRRDAARGPDRAPQAAAHCSAGAARLVDEHDVVDVSYASVRNYVARRRPQIQAEAGRTTEQACTRLLVEALLLHRHLVHRSVGRVGQP